MMSEATMRASGFLRDTPCPETYTRWLDQETYVRVEPCPRVTSSGRMADGWLVVRSEPGLPVRWSFLASTFALAASTAMAYASGSPV